MGWLVCQFTYGQGAGGYAFTLPLPTGVSSNAISNGQTFVLTNTTVTTLPREVRSGRIAFSISQSAPGATNGNATATNIILFVAPGYITISGTNSNGTSAITTNWTSWNETPLKVTMTSPNGTNFQQTEAWFEMQGINLLKPVAISNTTQGSISNFTAVIGLPRN